MRKLGMGDSIRVKAGTSCPGVEDLDIGGWQGWVVEAFEDMDGDQLVEFIWDSPSLRALPEGFIEQSEREGLDWSTMTLLADEVERAEPRDALGDAELVKREIDARLGKAPVSEPDRLASVEEVLESLSAERLRLFLGRLLDDDPGLEDELRVFALGAQESPTTAEEYEARILADLEAADLGASWAYNEDWHGRDRRRRYWEDEDDEAGDEDESVDSVLQPYRTSAEMMQEQGNWAEAAKIHEALLHVCAKIEAGLLPDADLEHGEDQLESECGDQAQTSLEDWASTAAAAPPGPVRQKVLGRLLAVWAENPYQIQASDWDRAIDEAVLSADEARAGLEQFGAVKVRSLARDPGRSLALLRLLLLAGDLERFFTLGKNAASKRPDLGLLLAEKLLDQGRRAEAIAAAEQALKQTAQQSPWHSHHEAREPLQRLLLRTYDRGLEGGPLAACARDLLFESGDVSVYSVARGALTAQSEREELLRDVPQRCPVPAAVQILAQEERWEELLRLARAKVYDDAFPEMIRLLRERSPQECFELYRGLFEQVARSNNYAKIAASLREMRQIPGHDAEFWRIVEELLDTPPRRPSLLAALGELASECRERQAQRSESLLASQSLEQLRGLDLEELVRLCPVTERDRERLKRDSVPWQRGQAALVWALLVKGGGYLEADELTSAIGRAKGFSREKSMPIRGVGLRMLEALGHVEIEREGQRTRAARLLGVPAP